MVRQISLRLAALACVFAVALCGGGAMAKGDRDSYRPGEFLTLDLARAVLSPKPLGPISRFEPVPVEAKTDAQVVNKAPGDATRKIKTAAKPVHVRPGQRHPNTAHVAVRKHRNPLDAQAFDARIQVWPCRSGGICSWQTGTAR